MTYSKPNQVFTWNCSNLSAKRPFSRRELNQDPGFGCLVLVNKIPFLLHHGFEVPEFSILWSSRDRFFYAIDRGNLSAHTSELVNPIFWFHH